MPEATRLRFPDGLRGLAALAVVMPHTVGFYVFANANAFVRAVPQYIVYGRHGVQVFFVVSGFVIAHALRGARMPPRNVATFIARRSVRLDPPYWAGIALMLAYTALHAFLTKKPEVWPTAGGLVAHLFYMQEVLGYPEINLAFWTLCIEFQFYLGFAIFLALVQAWAVRKDIATGRAVAIAGAALFACSLPWAAFPDHWDPGSPSATWVIWHLHAFLAGAVTLWTIDGLLSDRVWLCAAVGLAVCIAIHPSAAVIVVLATMTALYAASRLGGIGTWLSQRSLQYLGRISYSIYLVHVPIAQLVLGLRVRLAPNSNAASLVFQLLVIALAIGAASVLHAVVEAPCIRLSKRLKKWERTGTGTGLTIPAAVAVGQDTAPR